MPTDEDSLIRHHTLSPADRLEIAVRRRKHNQLGFAVQLCLMRYPGRTLMANEIPPRTMLHYIAEQLDAEPESFNSYARREPTRLEHVSHLLAYLGMRTAAAPDRRAALISAIETAATTDKGSSIAKTIVTTMRERNVVLPTPDTIKRIGLAARTIARRRAEAALISGFSAEQFQGLDDLLKVHAAIAKTRFHWLRSAPDAPGSSNLVAMMERLPHSHPQYDPRLQGRIHSGRWDKMIRARSPGVVCCRADVDTEAGKKKVYADSWRAIRIWSAAHP